MFFTDKNRGLETFCHALILLWPPPLNHLVWVSIMICPAMLFVCDVVCLSGQWYTGSRTKSLWYIFISSHFSLSAGFVEIIFRMKLIPRLCDFGKDPLVWAPSKVSPPLPSILSLKTKTQSERCLIEGHSGETHWSGRQGISPPSFNLISKN